MDGGVAGDSGTGPVGSAFEAAVDAAAGPSGANNESAATPAEIFFVGAVFRGALGGGLDDEEPASADSCRVDVVFVSFFFFFLFSFDAVGVSSESVVVDLVDAAGGV